ncbi:TPA: metal ABC transporter ATP-binding protein [Candidatus Bipolaricaulota bacterium]|nr:metal ABC transporter ATP-binding protein [Candidatus Bipolaricaulota bacterium]
MVPILETADLVVSYNGRPALEGVSFAVWRGEGLAVVGPNGAGKSTLLKVLAGLLRPVRGEVCSRIDRIAYLPQRIQVDWAFPLTVADVVMLGRVRLIGWLRRPSSRDRRAVSEALERVGLGPLARRRIDELSGGQQQRMFLARALAQEAELLLLDESLAGLDPTAQEEILQVLEELRRGQGRERPRLTILLATHDLNLAGERFDRVMLLNRRLIGLGKADEVLTPDNLRQAYGSHLRLIQTPEGLLVLSDTCCGGG